MKRLTLLVATALMGFSLAACGEYIDKKTPEKGTEVHPTTIEQEKTTHTREVKPETIPGTGTTTNPGTPTTPNTTQPTH